MAYIHTSCDDCDDDNGAGCDDGDDNDPLSKKY